MFQKRPLYFVISLALSCYYGDVFAAKNCREGEYDLDNKCVECPEDAYCPTSGKKSEWSTQKNGGKRPDCWSGSDYSSYGIYCCPKDYPYTKDKGKVHDTNCYKNDYPNLTRIFKDGRTEELPHVNVPAGKFGDSDDCTAGCYCDGYKMAYVDPHYRDVEDLSHSFNDHQNYRKMLTAYCKRDEKLFKEAADRISSAMPRDKLNFEYIEKIYSNLGMYRCPSEYPQSDKGAKSASECYKLDGSTKVYLKTASLKDALKQKSKTPVASLKDSLKQEAEIKIAELSLKGSSKQESIALTAAVDLKKAISSKEDVSTKESTEEITDASGVIKCEAGKYLPAGKTECKVCEGVNKYCPGGSFDIADADQGIYSCPTGGNVNGKQSGCKIKLSKSSMYNGIGIRTTAFQQQCWAKVDAEQYNSCIFPTKD